MDSIVPITWFNKGENNCIFEEVEASGTEEDLNDIKVKIE